MSSIYTPTQAQAQALAQSHQDLQHVDTADQTQLGHEDDPLDYLFNASQEEVDECYAKYPDAETSSTTDRAQVHYQSSEDLQQVSTSGQTQFGPQLGLEHQPHDPVSNMSEEVVEKYLAQYPDVLASYTAEQAQGRTQSAQDLREISTSSQRQLQPQVQVLQQNSVSGQPQMEASTQPHQDSQRGNVFGQTQTQIQAHAEASHLLQQDNASTGTLSYKPINVSQVWLGAQPIPFGHSYNPKLQFIRQIHPAMQASPDIPAICKDRFASFVIMAMVKYEEIQPGMNLWEIVSQPRMVVYIRSNNIALREIPATIGDNPGLPHYGDILNDPPSTSLDQRIRVPITDVQPPLDKIMIRCGGPAVMREYYIAWRAKCKRPIPEGQRKRIDPLKQPDRWEFAKNMEIYLEQGSKKPADGKPVPMTDTQRATLLRIRKVQQDARTAAEADFNRRGQAGLVQSVEEGIQSEAPKQNPLNTHQRLPDIPSALADQGNAYLRRWSSQSQPPEQPRTSQQQQSPPVTAQASGSRNSGHHGHPLPTVSTHDITSPQVQVPATHSAIQRTSASRNQNRLGDNTYSSPSTQQASNNSTPENRAHTGSNTRRSSATGSRPTTGQGNQAPTSMHPNAAAMYNMYGGNPSGQQSLPTPAVPLPNPPKKARNPRASTKSKKDNTSIPSQSRNIQPQSALLSWQSPAPMVVNGIQMYDIDTVRMLCQQQHERTMASVHASMQVQQGTSSQGSTPQAGTPILRQQGQVSGHMPQSYSPQVQQAGFSLPQSYGPRQSNILPSQTPMAHAAPAQMSRKRPAPVDDSSAPTTVSKRARGNQILPGTIAAPRASATQGTSVASSSRQHTNRTGGSDSHIDHSYLPPRVRSGVPDLPNHPVDMWFCYVQPGETPEEHKARMMEHILVYSSIYEQFPDIRARHDREFGRQ